MGDLHELLCQVFRGVSMPDEVILVVSGGQAKLDGEAKKESAFEVAIKALVAAHGARCCFIKVDNALPGEARNVGVSHSKGSVIAFLDVKTMPTQQWLSNALSLLQSPDIKGVFGSRYYFASSGFTALLRDAIYGQKATRSLAGSVFKRECLSVIGQMIAWSPAGEDVDWIKRIDAHKLRFIILDEANTNYIGLEYRSIDFFINKWWRYYHNSRLLAVNDRDRWLSYGLSYLLLSFLAFNWNYTISEIVFGTSIYIPHVTKAVMFGGPMIYGVLRGVYLPFIRGVPVNAILPTRWLALCAIAAVLDVVKFWALLVPKLRIK
jgi:glycosyltransferase involved in cell wall biosynthesis